MGVDPLSPIAPARPRLLLLPVGKISRTRFRSFVQRIQRESMVRLGDVSPDRRPNRTMFSPLAAPTGLILYDASTALPPDSHLALSPFELFRLPLVVIGIADGIELVRKRSVDDPTDKRLENKDDVEAERSGTEELREILESLREQYSKALVHQIVLFDSSLQDSDVHEGILPVPPLKFGKTTTMKTVMCDITSLLLAEMTTFAKSLQGQPSIESPGILQGNPRQNGHLSWGASHTGSLPHQAFQRSRTQSPFRSGSTAGISEDGQHRMSMPPKRFSVASVGSNALGGARGISPPSRTQTPPPTTFDEIAGSEKVPAENRSVHSAAKSSLDETRRELSRDRVEVHGFGSGSMSERARNKGKGRVGLVIGQLYLLAGRWEDAVRESVDSANIAKANSDHLWHAKALETILVSLIMLAWAGLDFQIPSVCYGIAEKASASLRSDRRASVEGQDLSASGTVPHRLVSLQNLVNLLPDLLGLILALLNRASSFAGETLPQLAYSEFIIRYGKILSTAHLCAGRLDNDALQHLVLNVPLPIHLRPRIPRIGISPSRTWIMSILFRAMPSAALESSLSTTDRTVVLAGIASVLSMLGFQRKKAFIMRELIASLVPGLVQARKLGAAEMGVHPAAGLTLADITDDDPIGRASIDIGLRDLDAGLQEILNDFTQTYGVVWSDSHQPTTDSQELGIKGAGSTSHAQLKMRLDDSNEAAIARALRHASMRSFGNHSLKLFALRYCINLCEALPDFGGILRFTSGLLRTAGSGIAPAAGSHDGSATLSGNEQVRLATNISRTISAGGKVGVKEIAADYWDEFLIRGVELLAPPLGRTVFRRGKGDLDSSETANEKTVNTPFIYNPYLKKSSTVQDDKLLVAGEQAEFRITLQNLFDFEIEIERLRLVAKGVEFVSMEHGTVVGPYRKQNMTVVGIPKEAGHLEITGCIVKISGCWERKFPIFASAWTGEREDKIRSYGLGVHQLHCPPSATVPSKAQAKDLREGPSISILKLDVVGEMPLVVVKQSGVSHGAMMLLEGETRSLYLKLQNLSTTTAVNVVLFSSEDSTTTLLQTAMRSKDTSPMEMYELELLFQKQAFRWKSGKDANFHIDPGGTSGLEVEVFGKPGLRSGVVQLDYTFLSSARETIPDRFYTRQVRIPLAVTVNASVEFVGADILRLSPELCRSGAYLESLLRGSQDQTALERVQSSATKQLAAFLKMLSVRHDTEDYCLLLLDLHNAWPTALQVILDVDGPAAVSGTTWLSSAAETGEFSDRAKTYTTCEVLQPGHTTRFLVPVPRIHLPNTHAPIPVFDSSNRRQFVVNSHKSTPEAEQLRREIFWYREAVLRLVHGSWTECETGRKGVVGLRDLRLNPRMMEALKLMPMGIEMSISMRANGEEEAVVPVGRSGYHVPTDVFVVLKIRLINRSPTPIDPILRLQPSLPHQPDHSALDISKRLLWNGLLQQPQPLLKSGETTEAELGLCFLCRGTYQINASVEESRTRKGTGSRELPQDSTDIYPETLERRLWHAEETCVIQAQDKKFDGKTV